MCWGGGAQQVAGRYHNNRLCMVTHVHQNLVHTGDNRLVSPRNSLPYLQGNSQSVCSQGEQEHDGDGGDLAALTTATSSWVRRPWRTRKRTRGAQCATICT